MGVSLIKSMAVQRIFSAKTTATLRPFWRSSGNAIEWRIVLVCMCEGGGWEGGGGRTSSVMRKAVNQFYCSSASSGRGVDDGWERVRADNYSRDDKKLKTHILDRKLAILEQLTHRGAEVMALPVIALLPPQKPRWLLGRRAIGCITDMHPTCRFPFVWVFFYFYFFSSTHQPLQSGLLDDSN